MNIFIYSDKRNEYKNNYHKAHPIPIDSLVMRYITDNQYEFIKCYTALSSKSEQFKIDKVMLEITHECAKNGNSYIPGAIPESSI